MPTLNEDQNMLLVEIEDSNDNMREVAIDQTVLESSKEQSQKPKIVPSVESSSSKIKEESSETIKQSLLDFMMNDRNGEPCTFQIISSKYKLVGKKVLQNILDQLCEDEPAMLMKKEMQRNMNIYYVKREHMQTKFGINSNV